MSTPTEKLTWRSEKEIEAKSPAKTRIKKNSGAFQKWRKQMPKNEFMVEYCYKFKECICAN